MYEEVGYVGQIMAALLGMAAIARTSSRYRDTSIVPEGHEVTAPERET